MSEEKKKVCRCGHDREHLFVSVKHHYSIGGWFWLLFGATAKPVRLSWVCRKCNETIDETSSPRAMEEYARH